MKTIKLTNKGVIKSRSAVKKEVARVLRIPIEKLYSVIVYNDIDALRLRTLEFKPKIKTA